jgi:four helix bundle protein
LGSLAELDTQLELSFELGFLEESLFQDITAKIQKVGKLISGLRSSLQNRQ